MVFTGCQLGGKIIRSEMIVPGENPLKNNPPRLRNSRCLALQKSNKERPGLFNRPILGGMTRISKTSFI